MLSKGEGDKKGVPTLTGRNVEPAQRNSGRRGGRLWVVGRLRQVATRSGAATSYVDQGGAVW